MIEYSSQQFNADHFAIAEASSSRFAAATLIREELLFLRDLVPLPAHTRHVVFLDICAWHSATAFNPIDMPTMVESPPLQGIRVLEFAGLAPGTQSPSHTLQNVQLI